MTDRIGRIRMHGRSRLYWWSFNLLLCAALLAFAMRG